MQVLLECWNGRYPFLQPGQSWGDVDEEELLAWIDESGPHLLVSADPDMSPPMKSFLLRCFDRNPNTRPAASDLASDPWLTGADQQVHIVFHSTHTFAVSSRTCRAQGLRVFIQSPDVCSDVSEVIKFVRMGPTYLGTAIRPPGSNHRNELEELTMSDAFEQALRSNGRPFQYTRLCLVGEGRAGKTALANALCNRPFVQTESTVGARTDCMEVTCTSIEAVSAAWKVLPLDTFVGFAQHELNWETAQRLAGSDGSGEGSIHDIYQVTSRDQDVSDEDHLHNSHFATPSSNIPTYVDHNESHSIANAGDIPLLASDSAQAPAASSRRDSISSRAIRSSTAAPVTKMDQELLLQLQGQKEPLRISLMDFGGQQAFYSLHHLYITRESVYLVVFNMECMVGADSTAETIKQCKSFLSFWLNSVYLHARAQSADSDGSVAPIILVGTHKDQICSPKQHEDISKMLWDEFNASPVWSSVIPFREGIISTGLGLLHFFPIDNIRKQSDQDSVDDVVFQIQTCIQKRLEKEDYLQRKVPLSWLQVFDGLMVAKETNGCIYLPLAKVQAIAGGCGLPCINGLTLDEEMIYMLKYFSGLGLLMHHDSPKLRDIVVLDTVRCLVNTASIIMCQHDIHELDVHQDAKRLQKDYYDELFSEGRLNSSLLPILWRDSLEIKEEICELMVHYGLMLPLLQDGSSSRSRTFLVPTLLPKQRHAYSNMAPAKSHFYFALGSRRKVCRWQDKNNFSVRDVAAQGFCPNGLFSRFTAKIISECQCTYGTFGPKCSRYETTAFFGRHQFTVVDLQEFNMIQVLVLVPNPRKLLFELSRLLQATIEEMIPNLAFCSAVFCDGGTNVNFEASCVANAHLAVLSGEKGLIERACNGLTFDAGEGPLSAVEVQHKFQTWLPPSGLRMNGYHAFLSYRWTGIDRQNPGFDEDLTMGIFQKLSMDALLGGAKEEVNVFLDKKRLQFARDFQVDFADALLASSLPVVVMSSAALLKFVPLKSDSPIDNLLLEWALIADLKASGVIRHCLTILFGTHSKLACICSDVLGDIFRQKMTAVLAAVENDQNYDRARNALTFDQNLDSKSIFDVIPDIAVKSVNDKARCILQAHGLPASPDIDTRSVRTIVNSLKSSLGVEAWEEAKKLDSSHPNEEVLRAIIHHCSNKVCLILEQDKPVCPLAAQTASSTPLQQMHTDAWGSEEAVQAQQLQLIDTEEAIIQRLVGILALADIVPISKRQEFAQTLYDNGISNEHHLRDSVLGDSPVIDLISDIGMKPVQKKNMLSYLAASAL
jgi:GTPase SAR1 family protein